MQAMGLPAVSSLHADIPEVVVDGETGLLAPERDVEGLADRLGYLVEHPDKWPSMGKAARAHIESSYEVKTQVARLETLYDCLIQRTAEMCLDQ